MFFYLGGYGDFDHICASICRELKKDFSNIELVYVTPYIDVSRQAKMKRMIDDGLYDSSVYPPIERAPLKFSITKRNEWMMSEADVVIAYVNRNYGGAYTALKAAMLKKKKIINIPDLES